eukprot:TRINITY_DN13205_c0_g1_i1.p1 TRINITY_DN13205_c0_g1~~TRINITY_DN13205_c0_g1_i1.p1  ORF type:complete len:133 (+),score=16.52 TRINITY_DN13205_c0_g1_i1:283-681(+)
MKSNLTARSSSKCCFLLLLLLLPFYPFLSLSIMGESGSEDQHQLDSSVIGIVVLYQKSMCGCYNHFLSPSLPADAVNTIKKEEVLHIAPRDPLPMTMGTKDQELKKKREFSQRLFLSPFRYSRVWLLLMTKN